MLQKLKFKNLAALVNYRNKFYKTYLSHRPVSHVNEAISLERILLQRRGRAQSASAELVETWEVPHLQTGREYIA